MSRLLALAVPLVLFLPRPVLAMSSATLGPSFTDTLAPPSPCDGTPANTVLVDRVNRETSIEGALLLVSALNARLGYQHHTVEVCPGTFTLPSTLFVHQDVALIAPAGPMRTILQGTMSEGPLVHLGVEYGSMAAPSLEGFTLTGAPGHGVEIDLSIYLAATDPVCDCPVTLRNLVVTGNGGSGVYFKHSTVKSTVPEDGIARIPVVSVLDTTVTGNRGSGVVLENWGTVGLQGSTVSGNLEGGLRLSSGGHVNDGTVVDNSTNRGGGGIEGGSGRLVVTGTALSRNRAGWYGGGISGDGVVLNGVVLQGNTAPVGGGVFANSVELQGRGNLVVGNTAELGGGLRVMSQLVGNSGNVVQGNTATNGGGVYLSSGGTLNGVAITENLARGDGGGVYVENAGGASLVAMTVTGNKASRGGAVFAAVADEGPPIDLALELEARNQAVVLQGCVLTGNGATEGGGVYLGVGLLKSTDSTIEANTATTGGGLWVASGAGAILKGGAVRKNTGSGATLEAGDQYLSSSFVDWTGNLPSAIQLGSVPWSAPADEFVCDEVAGCTIRHFSPETLLGGW